MKFTFICEKKKEKNYPPTLDLVTTQKPTQKITKSTRHSLNALPSHFINHYLSHLPGGFSHHPSLLLLRLLLMTLHSLCWLWHPWRLLLPSHLWWTCSAMRDAPIHCSWNDSGWHYSWDGLVSCCSWSSILWSRASAIVVPRLSLMHIGMHIVLVIIICSWWCVILLGLSSEISGGGGCVQGTVLWSSTGSGALWWPWAPIPVFVGFLLIPGMWGSWVLVPAGMRIVWVWRWPLKHINSMSLVSATRSATSTSQSENATAHQQEPEYIAGVESSKITSLAQGCNSW